MKPPSPLLGFNNNVRHKGRVFHIQTEDSGVRHPHIITHLFADGGRILKTTKTSYAEYLDAANMGEVVRQMMQDQHKAMFMALRDGQFDHLIDELPTKAGARPSSPTSTSIAAMPAVLPPGKAAPELPVAPKVAPIPAAATTLPSAARPATIPPPAPSAARPAPAAKLPEPPPVPKAPERPTLRPATMPPPPGAARPTAMTKLAETPAAPAAPRAPSVSPTMPVMPVVVPPPPAPGGFPAADSAPPEPTPAPHGAPRGPVSSPTTRIRTPSLPAPPPTSPSPMSPSPTSPSPAAARAVATQARPRLELDPAAIHRAPTPHLTPSVGTLASVVEATVTAGSGPNIGLEALERAAVEAEAPVFQQIHDLPPPPAAVLGARTSGGGGGYSSVSAPAPPPAPPPQTRGRYAPTRPSSIFSAVRPPEGASIFGEDLISEKSLDEVILSYLAEDLDGPGEKK